jgi:hypothetical protein
MYSLPPATCIWSVCPSFFSLVWRREWAGGRVVSYGLTLSSPQVQYLPHSGSAQLSTNFNFSCIYFPGLCFGGSTEPDSTRLPERHGGIRGLLHYRGPRAILVWSVHPASSITTSRTLANTLLAFQNSTISVRPSVRRIN